MKFVFDMEGKHPQVSAITHAWNTERYNAPPMEWQGSRADIMIVDCIDWDDDTKRREGEALYIEGDTAALRQAFQTIIELLDFNDEYQRKAKLALVARSVICPLCQRWNDPVSAWHGDGNGTACYGLLPQRKALVSAEEPPSAGAVDPVDGVVEG